MNVDCRCPSGSSGRIAFRLRPALVSVVISAGWAGAVAGCEILARDAVARAATPSSTSAAAYLTLENTCPRNETLTGVMSASARRVALHTQEIDSDGIAAMKEAEHGFELPAGGVRRLVPGGDHIMLMGLTDRLDDQRELDLELHFENSESILLAVPVEFAAR